MKHSLVLLTALATLAVSTDAVVASGPTYTVSIAEFDDTSGFPWKWNLASTWRTVLSAALREEPRVVVLSGQGANGRDTGPVSAQLVLAGAVTHVDAERSSSGGGIAVKGVNLRMGGRDHARVNVGVSVVEPLTGRVLASTDVEGDTKRRSLSIGYSGYTKGGELDAIRKEGLGKAMEDAAVEVAEWLAQELPSIPWKGAVVTVAGGEVLVNRGQRDGVGPGMTFVAGQEEALRDPTTGEVLKTVFHELARLEVVSVEERLATCKLLSGDASLLQPGSEVQLP